ncbi:MAG: DUF6526 family protein [Candidatus Acidiferrales bacterium]
MAQNFENHTRVVPAFHFGVVGILVINLLWNVWRIIHSVSVESVISLLLALAFLVGLLYARMFALTVQDRVIRLEMRLRLQQLLQADLRARISEFTVGQLIALRFASDAELPDLARRVLTEKLTDRKAIKKLIRNWEPDYQRA